MNMKQILVGVTLVLLMALGFSMSCSTTPEMTKAGSFLKLGIDGASGQLHSALLCQKDKSGFQGEVFAAVAKAAPKLFYKDGDLPEVSSLVPKALSFAPLCFALPFIEQLISAQMAGFNEKYECEGLSEQKLDEALRKVLKC